MKVGITGHQDLGNIETFNWINKSLSELIDSEMIELGITCLAIGADQLYAELLLKKNIPYLSIIPSKDYETTFKNGKDKDNYLHFLKKSENIEYLQNDNPNEQAFYEAGKKLVDMADYIIAIWNGKKAKGLGGTGDIVEYALKQNKKVIHINPILHTVKEIIRL